MGGTVIETVEPPFRFDLRELGSGVIQIEYAGYMPADDTHVVRTERAVMSATRPVGLLYRVSDFTDFHRSQVALHGALFARLGKRVTGIAVVGARPVVRFGAISVGLISKTPLKTFDLDIDARDWLASLRGR